MSAHPIVLEGRPVIYLAASEPVPEEAMDDIVGFDFFEDQELKEHPRLRRILTKLVRPKPLFYGVLHWSDGSDLTDLDRKVLQGIADDKDFAGALVAEPRTIICPNCQSQLRVLAVDTGQAIFSFTLPERLRKHELKTTCPGCKAKLSLPIVEFLGESLVP